MLHFKTLLENVEIFKLSVLLHDTIYMCYLFWVHVALTIKKVLFIKKNLGSKLTIDWTKLGLHLILGPQKVTKLIGSTADMNPSTQWVVNKSCLNLRNV